MRGACPGQRRHQQPSSGLCGLAGCVEADTSLLPPSRFCDCESIVRGGAARGCKWSCALQALGGGGSHLNLRLRVSCVVRQERVVVVSGPLEEVWLCSRCTCWPLVGAEVVPACCRWPGRLQAPVHAQPWLGGSTLLSSRGGVLLLWCVLRTLPALRLWVSTLLAFLEVRLWGWG